MIQLKRIDGSIIDESDKLTFIELVEKNKYELQRANLQRADLQGVNLQRANLQRANLQIADLQGVNLKGVNLQWAYLQEAYLQEAYLQEANLQEANLQGTNLQRANLWGADLQGSKRGNYIINNAPIQITGLHWYVIIWDEHMEIGCESHSFEDWKSFKDSRIKLMDDKALDFWHTYKDMLLGTCETRKR